MPGVSQKSPPQKPVSQKSSQAPASRVDATDDAYGTDLHPSQQNSIGNAAMQDQLRMAQGLPQASIAPAAPQPIPVPYPTMSAGPGVADANAKVEVSGKKTENHSAQPVAGDESGSLKGTISSANAPLGQVVKPSQTAVKVQ